MLLTAALLAVLLALAHSYLGERYILTRLFRSDSLPKLFGGTEFTQRTLRFAWHVTSLAWLGLAGVLVVVAAPSWAAGWDVLDVVAWTFAVSGVVALVGSRGRHLSWIVFGAIAALVWLADR